METQTFEENENLPLISSFRHETKREDYNSIALKEVPNSTPDEIREAARAIANAMNVEPEVMMSKRLADLARFLYLNLGPLRTFCMFLLLFFTFFEIPWWCHNDPEDCENSTVYLNSEIPKLPSAATDTINLCCLFVLLLQLFLKYLFLGKKVFIEGYTLILQTIIIILSIIDTFIAIGSMTYRINVYLSPFLRPVLFILMFGMIRKTFIQVVRIIPIIFELIVLMVFHLLFFAWFGLLLFYDIPDSSQRFSTFGNAILQLFTYLTTANNPDVRMPVYNKHRYYVFFFVIYELIGLYFLLPFIFATVYNNYKDLLIQSTRKYIKKKNETLLKAFNILDKNQQGWISFETCKLLLDELSQYSSSIALISDEAIDSILTQLNTNNDLKITKDAFLELCTIVKVDFKSADDYEGEIEKDSDLEQKQVVRKTIHKFTHWFSQMRHGKFYDGCSRVVNHPRFEMAIDVIVVMNSTLLGIQTYYYVTDEIKYEENRPFWEAGEWFFTLVFTFEMGFKLFVWGIKKYKSRFQNIFDAIITILALITSLATITVSADASIVRTVIVIRTLRLMRLITNIRRFRIIFATLIELMPFYSALLGLLVAVYYIFALSGIRAFGGIIYKGNPYLNGTSFDLGDYYPNNFNDFGSAIVVLFDLMVVNNWFIYMDAVAFASNEASRVYFFLFWFLTNLIVLNLLIANILDNVTNQLQKRRDADKKAKKALKGSTSYTPRQSTDHDPHSPRQSSEPQTDTNTHIKSVDELIKRLSKEIPSGNPSPDYSGLDHYQQLTPTDPSQQSLPHQESGVTEYPPPPVSSSQSEPPQFEPQSRPDGSPRVSTDVRQSIDIRTPTDQTRISIDDNQPLNQRRISMERTRPSMEGLRPSMDRSRVLPRVSVDHVRASMDRVRDKEQTPVIDAGGGDDDEDDEKYHDKTADLMHKFKGLGGRVSYKRSRESTLFNALG